MSKVGKLVKGILKTKKESVMGKLGDSPFDDPMEPWSAKYDAPVRKEEVQMNEGAFSSGQLKPSKELLDKVKNIPSTGTVRGKDSKGVYTAKTVNGKEVSRVYEEEQIDEVSLGTYKKDAEKQVKELEPHTKGEYGDIAKRAIERRKKGLARAKLREDVLTEDSWLFSYIRSLGYNPKIMNFAQRSKYARSNAFKHWKQAHMERRPGQTATMEGSDMCNVCGQTPCNCTHIHEGLADDILAAAHKAGIKGARVVSTAQKKRETETLLRKRAEKAKANPQPPRQHVHQDKYPLGGYNPVSHRSYSEEVENLDEAGTGLLMTYIKAKGLNPMTMDGNQRQAYSRSSEFKVFKQKHAKVRKEEFQRLVNTYGADNLAELVMSIQETSGMGERGEDWNEETGKEAPPPFDKPYKKKTDKVITDKSGAKHTLQSRVRHLARLGAKKTVKEEADKADTVTMDIPLLIRVLEYAREDAKTDMDLHKVVEKLIGMRDKGTLSMAEYDEIVAIKEAVEAKYGKDYQDMVKRVGQKAAQKPVDIKALAARLKVADKKELKELKKIPDNMDADDHLTREDLRQWFSKTHPEGGWKRINSKGEAIGPCAREPGEPKPKCMSNEKRAKLSKSERAAAVAAKRKHDPVADRAGKGGKPINVSNFGKGKLGEASSPAQQAAIAIAMQKAGKKPKNEEVGQIDEKNKPTNPALWSRAKSMARSKFDVYPSAYANGWASKWYKSKGGGWKSVKEDIVQEGIGNAEDSPMSATNSVKAMESAHRSKQMKSARMIKSLYKNKIKETTYDWEKDDKPNAKIVMKGGTTMTGQPRDTVEIEPVLKTRPNQTKPSV